jgi:hypothetical protein
MYKVLSNFFTSDSVNATVIYQRLIKKKTLITHQASITLEKLKPISCDLQDDGYNLVSDLQLTRPSLEKGLLKVRVII